jgi:hypothetical protein
MHFEIYYNDRFSKDRLIGTVIWKLGSDSIESDDETVSLDIISMFI